MILKNSLYTIADKRMEGSGIFYQILLDKNHFIYKAHFPNFIYKAHFPNEPITPGVCIIQIAKELLEDYLHEEYEISYIKNIKFLSVLSPLSTPSVAYVFDKITILPETNECKTQVQVQQDNVLFAKLSIIFKKSH